MVDHTSERPPAAAAVTFACCQARPPFWASFTYVRTEATFAPYFAYRPEASRWPLPNGTARTSGRPAGAISTPIWMDAAPAVIVSRSPSATPSFAAVSGWIWTQVSQT